jgi:hypothetical protein
MKGQVGAPFDMCGFQDKRTGNNARYVLFLDQLRYHFARPQRKFKLHLQWVLLCDGVVNPLHGLGVKFWRTAGKRFRLQRAPAALSVRGQPSVHRPGRNSQTPRYNLGAFPLLNAPYRSHSNLFECRVIEFARVIFLHAATESQQIHRANKI